MEILIEKTVTKTVTETLWLSGPTFYKMNSGCLIGIYSPEKCIKVYINGDYANASVGDYEILNSTKSNLLSEVTEEEFNTYMAQAILKISGTEIYPTLQRQTPCSTY